MKGPKNLIRKGLIISQTLLFRFLLIRAGGFLRHPERILDTVHRAIHRLRSYEGPGALADDLLDSLKALFRMLKAYAKGEYQGLERNKALLILGSILYFLLPIDIVPDAIPILGWLDDLSLFAWVANTLHQELKEFRAEQG
jgi:uncharacterized membrane protein YkvA (DUF1232 family)